MAEALFPEGCVLVVGGSGGIGGVVAREFARAGADVALTYRGNREKGEATADAIRAFGRRATVHPLTVGDVDQIETAIAAAEAEHGRVHTLVYAAAMLTEQVDIADISHAQWDQAVNQDLQGFFNLVKAMVPRFRAAGGGSFVNLGSAGDLWWPAKDALSVAPKAAIEALVRGIAKEEGRHGIRANSVLVGVIEAGMFLELTRQGVFDQAWTDEVQKQLCLKRWGQPEEIGHAAVFLASNKAAYITGQQIAVAGGFGV
ncbi:SDR family NAD(P)-dependent oxidoreductase [Sphingomonas sp. KC8]|uniref:SDR family NAD(P)-dependent oxidoreductase n=1 Tax=Sphingomonas sp. KC8 TaxID=1030157 RepID=UPI000300C007|nr:SDR family oxidoreductase [Sphingomonas sp. KC8]ARS28171.1 oxidoreductase [Sphingomonas sp. KC8]